MKTTIFYRLFLIGLLSALLPLAAEATTSAAAIRISVVVFAPDTVPSRKPAAKPEKEPSDKPSAKPSDKPKPDIKKVPKSRPQIKPKAVGERIKGKPPVRIRPQIKKPVKNIKRAVGKI